MTINVPAENFIQPLQQRIHQQLLNALPNQETSPSRLHQAMHYVVFNGGKRIRPLLVYATGRCFQFELIKLDPAATAIELIHCYSLTHDDLPAMDNDDYRRGQLSCHKAFDEATAILVGDALQSLAFMRLAQPNPFVHAAQQLKMIAVLAHAAGSLGMAGGQQLDLSNPMPTRSTVTTENIYRLKTGALFQASVRLGALAADCQHEQLLQQLDQFAYLLGLAFQYQDDYFDHHPSSSQALIDNLFYQAQEILESLTIDCTPLRALCQYLQERKY